MEVRGGDCPFPPSDSVASVVLLSGVHQISRVEECQRVAIEVQNDSNQRSAEREDDLHRLVHGGTEELAPLN